MFLSINYKGKQSHSWKEDIKLVLQEMKCEGVERITFKKKKNDL
jgi:hypothetical protein